MPLLSFASDQRRIRKQQKLDRQRATRKSIRGQLETLEDRKLLAVVADGNFGQLLHVPVGQTQTVERMVPVSHGADAALAVAANYTDSALPQIEVTINGGTTELLTLAIGGGGALILNNGPAPDVFAPDGTVVGHASTVTVGLPHVSGNTTLSTFVLMLPLGSEAMDRNVHVKLRGGVSTDFVAIAGSYRGVHQTMPVDGGAGAFSATPITTSSLTLPGVIEAGNSTLDAVFGVRRESAPNPPLTDMVPDPTFLDLSDGLRQDEIAGPAVLPSPSTVTASNALVLGAFSRDNDTLMDWAFVQQVAAFSHAAVEIKMASPGATVLYDGGDAPATYGTAIHAPKGPQLGSLRDQESLTTIAGYMGATALGDDLDGVDDEDGVAGLKTNGNALPVAGTIGAFVSQSMANNTGSVDVQVAGLTAGQTGYLTIFVDWNRDGDFADANETVKAGVAVTANGTSTYSFNVPTSSQMVAGSSYMRVRLHTASMGGAQLLAAAGHANDGEVEDYKIELIKGTEIHGLKFEDINGNGVREGFEPVMPYVRMDLAPGVDIWGNPVPPTYAQANGEFWFVNLGAGAFTVTEAVDITNINNDAYYDSNPTGKIGPGYSAGSVPVDQGLRRSTPDQKFTLAQGAIQNDVLFGNYVTGSLHGVKFNDANANGVWDAGELPAKGVSLDLWKFSSVSTQKFTSNKTVTTYNWTKVSTEKTDSHGEFWFTHLAPGTYELREQAGSYIQTTNQPTGDPNAKVNANQFGLNPADSKTAFQIVSRREYVWQANASKHPKDFDNNGVLTADEIAAGIADAALKVEVLATPGADPAPADMNQDLWFGNLFLANITGFKYEDVDRNGTFGGADVGLDNVKMTLTGTDLFGKAVTSHVLTSGGGNFTFSGLVPGNYSVAENAASDSNKDGTADAKQDMVLDGKVVAVTLKSGDSIDLWSDLPAGQKHRFANYVFGSIHGVKFIDANANGSKDAGEAAGQGFGFDLYKFDKSTTKTVSSGVSKTTYIWTKVNTATSDLHGEFWFTQLDPGTYEVVETSKTGWIQSTGQPSKDPNAAVSTTTQQGLNPTTSTTKFEIISRREYVWEANATKRAIDGMGGPLDGFIDAAEITAGLNHGALKNEVLATPGVDAAPADKSQDLWFGNYQLTTITGFKYEDVDRNGSFGGADVGLDNVKMTLTGTDGTGKAVTSHVLTSGGGNFTFSGLVPGSYSVAENAASDSNKDGTADAKQDMVLDGKSVTVLPTQLTSGKTVDLWTDLPSGQKHRFANYVYGSIHGVKFVDTNANGVWDKATEAVGKDFVFDLYKYDKSTTKTVSSGVAKTTYFWTKVTTATSNTHGEFWFTQLDPGTYEVVEASKGGWGQSTSQPSKDPNAAVSSTTQQGLNPATSTTKFDIVSRREFVWEAGATKRAIDGMGGPLDGLIDAAEVTAGLNHGALKNEVLATPGVDAAPADKSQDLWFGNYAFASVTGFKYEDVDRNGSFGGADVGLDNVKMTLTGTDGSGKAVTSHVLTSGGGNFTFSGLVPGNYSVAENAASDSNKDGTADAKQDMVLDGKSVAVTLKSGDSTDLWSDLPAGQKHRFANYVYGSIHGVKFIDANANGSKDAGEVAGQGFAFDLYKYDKSTATQTYSGQTKTTYFWTKVDTGTSDKHGQFWFTQLDPGTYEVVEAGKTGWIQSTGQSTKDPNAAVSTTTQQGLNPTTSTTKFEIISRREYVWEAGVTKQAIDGMGGPLDGVIDAAEITAGLNHGALKNEVLATPGVDAAPADKSQDLWFGNYQLTTITGFKYEDVDRNGSFGGADVGLDNVKMTLTGTDGTGKAVTSHVLTSGGGNFTFSGLVPGSYSVAENAASDSNKDGTADAKQDMVLDGKSVAVLPTQLTSGKTVDLWTDLPSGQKHRFANYVYGSIHGVKFVDVNANGVWDKATEAVGKDFVFDLYKFDKSTTKTESSGATKTTYMWTKVTTATSNTHGEFWFTQLDPGTYEVVEASKGGWGQSTSQPSKDPNAAVSSTTQQGLNPATSTTKFDIVSRREFVWEAGATKRAIDGMGGPLDGLIDAAEVTAGLNHGALKNEVLATPGVDAAPADKSQDLWFGNYAFASVTGFKYEDVDRNGSFGGADVGLDNVKMTLTGTDGSGKAVTSHVLTSGGGNFTFSGLVPGNYSVAENAASDSNKDGTADAKQDMVLDGKSVAVTLKSGDSTDLWSDLPAGQKHRFANYVFGSIHGVKFIDANANGSKDAGEAAGQGFGFDLYKFDKSTTKTVSSGVSKTTYIWTKVNTATSDLHGEFWFTQLDPGTYEVVETSKTGWIQSTGQPSKDPNAAVSTTTQQGLNPTTSTTKFEIISRREYVWEANATKRAIDGMGGPLDGFIDAAEITAGLNHGALKNEVLATPGVDAAPADKSQDLWFGNYQLTTITGFKYEDVDRNGSFGGADVGLDNVKMTLTGTDGTGKAVTSHVLTSGGGNFTFSGLVPGSYSVAENAASDSNKDGTADAKQDMVLDGKSVTVLPTQLTSGKTVDLWTDLPSGQKHRFANYVYGSIHGVKFVDTNANGVWDKATEAVGKDFVFDLYKYDKSTTKTVSSGVAKTTYFWTKVTTATSNTHGEFWFTQLDPGTYEVVEASKGGWGQSTSQPSKDPNAAVSSTTQQGLNPATSTTKFDIVSRREFVWEAGATKRAIDGMGGPLDGLIDAAEVTAGLNHGALKNEVLATPGVDAAPADKSQDLWFGNYAFASVTGFKYEDVDRNGSFGGADVGLDNVKMTLTGTDGSGKAVTSHVLTSGGGNFTFSGLVPGNYSVAENAASDSNKDGTADAKQDMVLDGKSVAVTLKSGDSTDLWSDLPAGQKHRFANYVYGSIHGVKFIDANANGSKDAGEVAGQGFAFDLYKYDKSTATQTYSGQTKTTYFWTKVDTGTSDKHGQFWFTQLDPGTYEVVEAGKTGWIQSTGQSTKDPNAAVSTTTQQGLNPTTSTTKFEIISRREYVWEAGVTKQAIDGMGGPLDGVIDAAEITAGLNHGALKNEVLATPGVDAAPADKSQDLWFGNYQLTTITGFKYEDVDRNGSFGGADVGLDNVKMTLTGTDGTGKAVTSHVLTSGGGNFTFSGLVPGSYSVAENAASDSNKDGTADAKQDMVLDGKSVAVLPTQLTSGKTVDLWTDLPSGQKHRFANYVYGSIHGVKFVDVNANGVWDKATEAVGKDFVFDLYKFDKSTTKTESSGATKTTYMWTKVTTATSNTHGEFWFTQLDPGTYEVVEASKGGWGQSTSQPSKDPNAAVSSTTQQGLNPATSTTKFDIVSRREFVWEAGATKRAIDGMGGPLDGLIDAAEVTAGLNHGALKNEVLATPGVDAAPADKSQDLWFGNYAFASVTGFKYEDVDRNGSFGGADVGLDNVKMTLTGTDGSGKAVTSHVLTSGGGNFTFSGLVPGNYSVAENAASDSNKDGTADAKQDMVLDGKSVAVTLKSGDSTDLWSDLPAGQKHRFANYVFGSIHGVKFIDANANGSKDAGEAAGQGFGFDLYKFDKSTTKTVSSGVSKTTYIWTKVNTATSDLHGEFWFTQLDPGTYEVVETSKTGWIQSTGQPSKDPNAAVSTTTQQGLNPTTSTTKFEIISRREYVWEANATKRAIDGMGGPLDGFIDAAEITAGLNHGALKNEVLATPGVDAAPADKSQDLWFGNYQLTTITGFKYEDVDRNGSFGGADVGLDNVKMTLTGTDGTGKAVTSHVLTSGGGNFTFSGLVPGSYSVAENAASDSNKDGTADAKQDMVLDGKSVTVLPTQLTSGKTVDLWTDLPSGQKHRFANYVYGSIHGVKFVDTNANGVWDKATEGVGSGFGFDLYKFDKSTTKTVSSGVSKTTYMWTKVVSNTLSNTHGEFWFTQLDPGTYEVVEAGNAGWLQSTSQPSKDPNVLNTNPATSTTKFDIVSRREFVWEAGATKRAIDGMGGPLDGLIDAAEIAAGLNHGALKNEVLATPGADAAPADKSQDLWFGNYQLATITGFKYEDVDRNGSFGGADVGLDNVKMTLTGTDGLGKSVTSHVLTSGGGNFTFTGLVPGSYSVSENTATDSNKDGTPDNKQEMVLDGKVVSVTLGSGATTDLWNNLPAGQKHRFANYVYGSIHGVKFLDFNKDGKWDKTGNVPGSASGPYAEPTLPGVQFDLYKFDKSTTQQINSGASVTKYYWTPMGTSTSDLHGEFWFSQLDPGTYTVRENLQGGLVQTTLQPQGDPNSGNGVNPATIATFDIVSRREYVWEQGASKRAIDGMGGPLNGFIEPSEVTAGLNKGALKVEVDASAGKSPDLVFGNNFITGSVHGFKFEDINGDQKLSAGEPGMGKVFIELHNSKGAIAFRADGSAATTVTDAAGKFWIDGLIPGSYTVHEDLSKTDTNGDLIPDNKQGLVQSTPTAPAVTVGPDQEMVWQKGAGMNPGKEVVVGSQLTIGNYVTGSIHGFKFLDLNADGKYDPSAMGKETPFPGVVFEVLDSKGASVGMATTNAAGEFWFNDLLPGTYTLQERLDLVDKNGNSIPDNKEGLAASTKSSIQLTINSRQELAWKTGAAMLSGKQSVEPDMTAKGSVIAPAVGPSTTATLTVAGTPDPIYSFEPVGFPASTGSRVFGFKSGGVDKTLFQATPGSFLQADFAPLPVDQVSIDVIADNNGDIGQMVAFDSTGTPISSVQTSIMSAGQTQKLTLTAPTGQKIHRIQASGLGGIVPLAVGLDNLQYTVNPLKQEVNVGDQLFFGNYYSGSIHGLKLQQGTNLPAPNLPFELIDAWSKVVGTAKSDATGHFWFSDVKPGAYTVVETATPSVISKLPSIPVVVGHAEAVFATDIPAANRMFHVGLQTPVDNHALTIHNTIRGSIHGTVSSQTGAPVVGVPVTIISGPTPGSTVTDGTGEFDFEDRVPGTYVLQIGGSSGQIRVITVDSGEEEVGKPGQSQLDPGQYENTNNDLNIVVAVADAIAPKIGGVRLNSSNWVQGYRDLVDVDTKAVGTGIGFKMPTGAAQATPWSWSNVNQIIVEFTEDVKGSGPGGALIPADFAILGVNNIAYTISSVSYNPATFRATLNMANFLPRDKYLVTANDLSIRDNSGNFLDGEFTNYSSTMPTGNGLQNGIFNFRFNVAPGNYDLSMDGVVATLDLGVVGSSFFTLLGQPGYNKNADADGDGIIATLDMGVLGVNFFTMLPAGSPGGFAQMSNGSNDSLSAEGEGVSALAGLVAGSEETSYDAYGAAVDSIFAEDDDEDENDGDLEYLLYDDLLSSDSDE